MFYCRFGLTKTNIVGLINGNVSFCFYQTEKKTNLVQKCFFLDILETFIFGLVKPKPNKEV